jgi:8-oxo-dGTP pyrophosphatase MutT (NUDIX family)
MARREGVGAILVRDGRVLVGLRRGTHGRGTWSVPGGNREPGETAEETALRELREEAGLGGADPGAVATTLDDFDGRLRYRTTFVLLGWAGGEPVAREPEKCAEWTWSPWEALPEPLFLPLANLRDQARLPAAALGTVEHVHVASAAGEPIEERVEVHVRAGIGIDGDRYAAGLGYYYDERVARDLTLVEAEVVETLGLAPGATRRNITTRGVRLNELVGRRFWVGEVLCEGRQLCEPCRHLAELTGKPILKPLVHRGGLRADVVLGGRIRRGDTVRA